MPIPSRVANDLSELVSGVLELASSTDPSSPFWFRGHASEEYKLLPGLLRHNKTSEQVFEREKRLLTRFRQRSMAYWPAGYPQTEWEHLFAMQHYGIPTRLLDWTENLFVAAYFALSGAGQAAPTIWCLDPVKWNRATPGLSEFGESIRVLTTADDEAQPYQPETERERKRQRSPVAIHGSHNSNRIVAQRGTFTIWGNDVRPMEEIAAEQQRPALWKVTLGGSRDELFRALQRLGFGETMIFPELSYLALELDRTEGWP